MLDFDNADLNKMRPKYPPFFYWGQELILLIIAWFSRIWRCAIPAVVIWFFFDDFAVGFIVVFWSLIAYEFLDWAIGELIFRMQIKKRTSLIVDSFESVKVPPFFLISNWFQAINDLEELSLDQNCTDDVRFLARKLFISMKATEANTPAYLRQLYVLQYAIALHYERNANEFE